MTSQMLICCNKRCLAIVITVAAFFLVALGMRIPYLKGDFHKPKQRPRATICELLQYKETLTQQSATTWAEPIPICDFCPVPPNSAVSDFSDTSTVPVSADVTRLLPPRAPPVFFS